MPSKTKTPKFSKETLLQLKSHIAPHTLIMVYYNTRLSPVARSARQKLNKEMLQVTIINQMYIEDIYRTFHLNTKDLPSSLYLIELFPKLITLWPRESLSRNNKIKITPCILSECHTLKLDIINNRKPRNSWKVNKSLLNEKWVKA